MKELLAGHRVLVLHGPPRHPRYYGQLERMNRDHRGWLSAVGPLDPERLAEEAHRMLAALNAAVPRRSLAQMIGSTVPIRVASIAILTRLLQIAQQREPARREAFERELAVLAAPGRGDT